MYVKKLVERIERLEEESGTDWKAIASELQRNSELSETVRKTLTDKRNFLLGLNTAYQIVLKWIEYLDEEG